jgi:hypothetical protein
MRRVFGVWVAFVDFFFEGRLGLWVLIAIAVTLPWLAAIWSPAPWLGGGLLLAGLATKLGQVALAMRADTKVKYPPKAFWRPFTPLSRTDPSPPASPVTCWSKADLDALLPDPRESEWIWFDLFVPAYGRSFRIRPELADRWQGLSSKTVDAINDVIGWTAADRLTIRSLLVDYAQTTRETWGDDPDGHLDAGPDEIEDIVCGADILIDETDETRHRMSAMALEAPWDSSHGLYVVIRDGRPVAVREYDTDLWTYDQD